MSNHPKPPNPSDDATRILGRMAEGDARAADELLPLVYEELRALASAFMRAERKGHTLQPTAIVHEAYLRMVQSTSAHWSSRTHFMAIAASAIRRVLIDHARRTNAQKRGGERQRVALADDDRVATGPDLDLLDLNEALERLAAANPRQSRIVELRFFGGLTNEEVATVMDLSRATVSDEWAFARAWLAREMEGK
ncbi:MAG: sigma-70 family RNA polymerase sigma factor [Phycisphaerales bacterium]